MINEKIVDTVEKLQNASRNVPKVWDGRSAILEMKEDGSKQWRQMEWMGFYFEFLSEIHFACFDTETLSQCGGSFQKGFRNADGSPRREKGTVNIRKVPNVALVATQNF